jgi:hypothetical protein
MKPMATIRAGVVVITLMAILSFTCLTPGLHEASAQSTLIYRTNDLSLSPTNVIGANVLAGTNIHIVRGSRGQVTLNVIGGGGGDPGGTNARQWGSINLTNWSNIPTGAMANIPSVDWLTNATAAISNYVTAATNSASVTNWIVSRQPASASLTNASGNPNLVTNILGSGTVTVTSNNLGTFTIAGSAQNGLLLEDTALALLLE